MGRDAFRHAEEPDLEKSLSSASPAVPAGRKVRVALTANDYERAVTAHRLGARVMVEGGLTTVGNRYWLLNGRLLRDDLFEPPELESNACNANPG